MPAQSKINAQYRGSKEAKRKFEKTQKYLKREQR